MMRRISSGPKLAAGTLVLVAFLVTNSAAASANGPSGVPASARPSMAQVSKCAAAPATWMGCLVHADQAFGKLPISELALPGSDNAGTFNLDAQSFDTQKGSACTGFVAKDASLGKVFGRWTSTQDETITEQLDQGIRFIELQVAYNGNGSVMTGWRVVQSQNSEWPLYDYLDQVAVWAKAHPSEAVIVQLGRVCYDNTPSPQVDAGLWSNFASPGDFGGKTTLTSVAFDAASPTRSFATTSIDQVVTQGGGGHNVVVLVPDNVLDSRALLTKYRVHPVFTANPGDNSTGSARDLRVAMADAGVTPTASNKFASANSQIAGYPLDARPAMGSLAGTGLYETKLAYSFNPREQEALFAGFGGLIQPYTAKSTSLPAWEAGLWSPGGGGVESRNQILAKWGHRANVVLADGVENGGYIGAVIDLNAR